MKKEEFATILGNHILNAIQKIQDEKKDFGQEIIVPFKIPQTSNEPDFIFSVGLKMPRFVIRDIDGNSKVITMAEYYGWNK